MSHLRSIFLIRAECGDYYCGCGGGHVCAVADDVDEAARLLEESKNATHTYVPGGREYKTWTFGHRIEEVPLNELLKEARG